MTIPIEAIEDSTELEPVNIAQALQNGAALMRDAVIDGGLTIDVYTTEGTDEDVLVYEEGDTIQFFFRVNQPAFLRLTYKLATGEIVLLEDRFYIGVEMVNRPVRLPYTFTVVPPFGVERLIVTGTTTEPPPARTYPTTIDGQTYDVFDRMEDVVARTRGIAKTPTEDRDASVGETHVVLTTIQRASR